MYSQNEEEKYILEYFKDKTGTFCEIGSNDGVTLSNTWALAKLGWRGVHIEPSRAFHKLRQNYEGMKGFYFYKFAIGTKNGKVMMKESGNHLNSEDVGLLSTMCEEDYNKWKSSTQFTEVEVDCLRWKTFLNRASIKNFDFVNIDIEGLDLAVLKQIDLIGVSMICIEWNSKPEFKVEVEKYLASFDNYRLIYTSNENLIYAL
jgi:FkbM family methyltransferase